MTRATVVAAMFVFAVMFAGFAASAVFFRLFPFVAFAAITVFFPAMVIAAAVESAGSLLRHAVDVLQSNARSLSFRGHKCLRLSVDDNRERK